MEKPMTTTTSFALLRNWGVPLPCLLLVDQNTNTRIIEQHANSRGTHANESLFPGRCEENTKPPPESKILAFESVTICYNSYYFCSLQRLGWWREYLQALFLTAFTDPMPAMIGSCTLKIRRTEGVAIDSPIFLGGLGLPPRAFQGPSIWRLFWASDDKKWSSHCQWVVAIEYVLGCLCWNVWV